MSPFLLFCFAVLPILDASQTLQKVRLRPRETGERTFTDEDNREMFFHGVNAVVKGPPWIPVHDEFSTDLSLADRDFKIMKELGLNVLRLGTMWPGIEPVRGQYNETYLSVLKSISEKAAAYGIYTILDMHQDILSEKFCGEGIPEWAVKSDGGFHLFGSFPAPLAKPFNRTDARGFPVRQDCAKHQDWSSFSVAEDYTAACQALWKNVDGIGDAWAQMWGRVASIFKGSEHILGVELMNEPFAGDFYHNPLIMVPYPFPRNADKINMQPVYDKLNTAIRAEDAERLVFFAGVTWDDFGVGFDHPPGGTDFADRSVVAYHYYVPPQMNAPHDAFQFKQQQKAARRLRTGSMLTETCFSTNDHSAALCGQLFTEPGGIADRADAALQSWVAWEWKSFCRETAETLAGESQWAAWGACKTGYGPAWNATTQEPPDLAGYARTYARAVAGNTTSMFFNVTDKAFKLVFKIDTHAQSPTEIFVSSEHHYPKGLQVFVSPPTAATASYDQAQNSNKVLVRHNSDATYGQEVTVKIIKSFV
ncbi:hypothetical protein CYMTET_52756 [Cymbomonas tetramitiformis]|uniref:Endoglycoceramidase n=1 Tax=Cymbomonas tetramitiformis TaxID=36881 RepID=A0AAE0BJI1_9CHLO|nr:hypothetical protein CYMTET_52756 [Cymbomonas tetramitiformis]